MIIFWYSIITNLSVLFWFISPSARDLLIIIQLVTIKLACTMLCYQRL